MANENKPVVDDHNPECVRCKRPMKLATTVARFGDTPGLRLYTCESCGAVSDRPMDKER
jgi:hypothetical protein